MNIYDNDDDDDDDNDVKDDTDEAFSWIAIAHFALYIDVYCLWGIQPPLRFYMEVCVKQGFISRELGPMMMMIIMMI